MTKKYIVIGALALAFILTAVTLTTANISFKEMVAQVAGVTAGEKVADALLEDIGSEDLVAGAVVGPEIQSDVTVRGVITEAPGVVSTTTTGSSATLVRADIEQKGLTLVTIGGAVATGADFTYTFPASTTLRNMLPYVGARSEQCFMLTATTSESQLIFAAGTGIDFRYASSTATAAAVPSLQAGVGQEICFKYMRQPTDFSATSLGDITARIEVMSEGD